MDDAAPLVAFDWPLVAWDVDLIAHPELLVPPEPLVPFLAWPGRLTELAGPDKIGKSTLLRQAAIAVATRGEFLGHQLNGRTPGKVLWFGLEESLEDMIRPLVNMGYRPSTRGIGFCRRLASLEEFYQALDAAGEWLLIVVDTLAAFGYAVGVESERDETEMTRVLHVLLDIARTGPAVILNHHVTKSFDNPRERGSGAIAATCDVVLTMSARKDDESVVDVKARGRMPVLPFSLRKSGGLFTLTEAPPTTVPVVIRQADQVLEYLRSRPGSSATRMAMDLKIRKETVLQILLEHERAQRVKNLSSTLNRPQWAVTVPTVPTVPGTMGTAGNTVPVHGSHGSPPTGGRNREPWENHETGDHHVPGDLDRGEAWEPDELDLTD